MNRLRVLLWSLFAILPAAAAAEPYRVGRASADITLPVWGIQMLGYVHPQQVGEGLRQRQFARAFVVADAQDQTRLAYVTCEVAFVTHTVKLAVLERLAEKLPDRYTQANLILAGTHTHGVPGGYHHHISMSMLGGDFFTQAFDALADGIAEAVVRADADLKPGRILFAQGEVIDASANRSAIAYRNNPPEEQAQYKHPVDVAMTMLKFERGGQAVGLLNWFAVHPTSVNFHYKLTTSDNKGYAAYLVEQAHGARQEGGDEFVAAFANSNCGDVTPNLNLDATGPGATDLESCAIIGRRQAEVALKLLETADEELSGPIQFVHAYLDFSQIAVSEEFTGAGPQHTCPSAWGYAFAAGSDAEGGGHALFKEGMTKNEPSIDALIKVAVPNAQPTPEFLECQKPKAVLIASGLARPPMHEQVLPLGLARIGQLVLVIGPAEFTTMTGRRFRTAVGRELGVDPRYVVVAGYSNDFAGYVTTWHEYQLQQYEGGHTLFGPWSEAAYRQEFVRLARALRQGEAVTSSVAPTDMRTRPVRETKLDGPDELSPPDAQFGDVATPPEPTYAAGQTARAVFWTGSPVNEYDRHDQFLAVERQTPQGDYWEVVRRDLDWDTTAQWQRILANPPKRPPPARTGIFDLAPPRYSAKPDPFQVTVAWEIPADAPPGTYRLVHYGRFRREGKVERFTAHSPPFQVTAP